MIVPHAAEAETRQFLRDVFDVGWDKPLGYVSCELVRAAGLDVLVVKALLEEGRERSVYYLEESECGIFGGALYAYHHNALAGLMNQYEKTIHDAGWPYSSVKRFVLAVATVGVTHEQNPKLYECIGRAFADARFRPPTLSFPGPRDARVRAKKTKKKKRRTK